MELRLAAAVANDDVMTAPSSTANLHTSLLTWAVIGDRQVRNGPLRLRRQGRNCAGSNGILISIPQAEQILGSLNTYQGIAEQREQARVADTTSRKACRSCAFVVEHAPTPTSPNKLTVSNGRSGRWCGCTESGARQPVEGDRGDPDVKIAAAVHDEIILLAREDKAVHYGQVLKCMEAAKRVVGRHPSGGRVKIGKRWSETH